jgi:hypothetical protein
MALDELTLLINRCRRLTEDNDNDYTTDKIEELRNKIYDLLKKSNEKVIVKGYSKDEVSIEDFDYDDIIEALIDHPGTTVRDYMIYSINETPGDYIYGYDKIIIEDTNGKELDCID